MSQPNKTDSAKQSGSLAIAAIQATIKQVISEGREVQVVTDAAGGLAIHIPSLTVKTVDGKRRIVVREVDQQVDASTPASESTSQKGGA